MWCIVFVQVEGKLSVVHVAVDYGVGLVCKWSGNGEVEVVKVGIRVVWYVCVVDVVALDELFELGVDGNDGRLKCKGKDRGGKRAALGGADVGGVGVDVLVVIGPESGCWSAVPSGCEFGKAGAGGLSGVDDGLSGDGGVGVGEVDVEYGVVIVLVVVVVEVCVELVGTAAFSNAKLVRA